MWLQLGITGFISWWVGPLAAPDRDWSESVVTAEARAARRTFSRRQRRASSYRSPAAFGWEQLQRSIKWTLLPSGTKEEIRVPAMGPILRWSRAKEIVYTVKRSTFARCFDGPVIDLPRRILQAARSVRGKNAAVERLPRLYMTRQSVASLNIAASHTSKKYLMNTMARGVWLITTTMVSWRFFRESSADPL